MPNQEERGKHDGAIAVIIEEFRLSAAGFARDESALFRFRYKDLVAEFSRVEIGAGRWLSPPVETQIRVKNHTAPVDGARGPMAGRVNTGTLSFRRKPGRLADLGGQPGFRLWTSPGFWSHTGSPRLRLARVPRFVTSRFLGIGSEEGNFRRLPAGCGRSRRPPRPTPNKGEDRPSGRGVSCSASRGVEAARQQATLDEIAGDEEVENTLPKQTWCSGVGVVGGISPAQSYETRPARYRPRSRRP